MHRPAPYLIGDQILQSRDVTSSAEHTHQHLEVFAIKSQSMRGDTGSIAWELR
jgi:hypothetical protein